MVKVVKREDFVYKTNTSVHNIQQYEKLRSFIFAVKITFPNVDKDASDLLNDFPSFKKETKPRHVHKKS